MKRESMRMRNDETMQKNHKNKNENENNYNWMEMQDYLHSARVGVESHPEKPFNCLLNVNSKGTRQSSSGSWFHKEGATLKKILPLLDLWAFLGVVTQKSLICQDLVCWAVDVGERCYYKHMF